MEHKNGKREKSRPHAKLWAETVGRKKGIEEAAREKTLMRWNGRKPIHLPQDFFQLTFHYLRFVQIIIALRSNQTLASSLLLPLSLFPYILPRAAGTRALPPLAPPAPRAATRPPAPRAARPASHARRRGPRAPAGHAPPRAPPPAPSAAGQPPALEKKMEEKNLFNILKIDSTFFEMLVQHFWNVGSTFLRCWFNIGLIFLRCWFNIFEMLVQYFFQ